MSEEYTAPETRKDSKLPGESLIVIMQTDDTVTFREAGEPEAWLTSDCAIQLGDGQ